MQENLTALKRKKKLRYSWSDGLLIYLALEEEFQVVTNRTVLPNCNIKHVLVITRDKSGHLGSKKVRSVMN